MRIKIFLVKQFKNFLGLFIFIVVNGNVTANNMNLNWEYISKETQDICNSVQKILAPSQDFPDLTTKKALKNCNADSFYYGFQNTPDYLKARECALIKNDYNILTMIYANGKGVKRDLSIAIHYACMMDAAPIEMEERVKHLYKMRDKKDLIDTFDICDDITSGYMITVCLGIKQGQEKAQQKNYLDIFKKKLTSNEQKKLEKLRNASIIYFDARMENEIDRFQANATAHGIIEEMNLNKQMLKKLKKTEQCIFPTYTLTQYQKIDNKLNVIYNKIQKKLFAKSLTVTINGIQKTERAWIKYRNAWVDFGYMKCPEISAISWNALITKERVIQLEALANLED
ncbi:lysozyme inhibitor LprI family protein [Legionella drancourtii]|uniref:Lysozyme inhibitor LprI-like N-terminal domain-containing protein n=1 Tax=Legionella drancourtii LLAP12 TaxID=658187 RepID=G9EQN4_9GAMM|nr:lysozyme inhibitor LprI family protein [Legionella drancourtii]EHL30397.1 hypothetical protein LDG_7582 [Legionella drancourtii LLAP12]